MGGEGAPDGSHADMLARALIDACSAASYARPSNAGRSMRVEAHIGRGRKSQWEDRMQRRWYTAGAIIAGLAMVATACTGSTGGGGGGRRSAGPWASIIARKQPAPRGERSGRLAGHQW